MWIQIRIPTTAAAAGKSARKVRSVRTVSAPVPRASRIAGTPALISAVIRITAEDAAECVRPVRSVRMVSAPVPRGIPTAVAIALI